MSAAYEPPPPYRLTEADNSLILRAHKWSDAHRDEQLAALASLVERARLLRRARDERGQSVLAELLSKGWQGPRPDPASESDSYERLEPDIREAVDLTSACDLVLIEGVPDANEPEQRAAWASEVLALADCRVGPGRRTFWYWLLASPSRVQSFLQFVEVALGIVEAEPLVARRSPTRAAGAMLSASDLAIEHGVKPDALRKALERERGRNLGSWFQETAGGARNEPRFLYKADSPEVIEIVDAMLDRASDGRPTSET